MTARPGRCCLLAILIHRKKDGRRPWNSSAFEIRRLRFNGFTSGLLTSPCQGRLLGGYSTCPTSPSDRIQIRIWTNTRSAVDEVSKFLQCQSTAPAGPSLCTNGGKIWDSRLRKEKWKSHCAECFRKFPQVRLSRTGIAMLAAEIEALERKCGMMRCPRMRVADRRPELN